MTNRRILELYYGSLVVVILAACNREAVPLIAPAQLSPATETVFNTFPRKTNFVWTRVPGAAAYGVEVEPYCPEKAMWCGEAGATGLVYVALGIKDTVHTFEHVGAQPGRWRVWAVDAAGTSGPKTGWWQFDYTR